MRIEYLLFKSNNDICSNIDSFKSLLTSNLRVIFDQNNLLNVGDSVYSYYLSMCVVESAKEVSFNLIIETQKKDHEGAEELEKFDQLLHRINNEYKTIFKINTIWNDFSIFYASELYSKIGTAENLLRKIIYLFMSQSLGSRWFDKGTPMEVQKQVKNTIEKNNIGELVENQLYYADFIQLSFFFFGKYALVDDKNKLIEDIKSIDNLTEEKKKELLDKYEKKSNWDRYFSDKISVEDLWVKWGKLYEYRNSVAHFKEIKKTDHDNANKILDELIPAFKDCIETYGAITLNDEERKAVSDVADATIGVDNVTDDGILYPYDTIGGSFLSKDKILLNPSSRYSNSTYGQLDSNFLTANTTPALSIKNLSVDLSLSNRSQFDTNLYTSICDKNNGSILAYGTSKLQASCMKDGVIDTHSSQPVTLEIYNKKQLKKE